jgi:hypothetical protein
VLSNGADAIDSSFSCQSIFLIGELLLQRFNSFCWKNLLFDGTIQKSSDVASGSVRLILALGDRETLEELVENGD